MTTNNLSAIRIEGSEARIRKMLTDLDGRATVVIRGGKGVLYVGVPPQELGWLDKVARDRGCKKQEVRSLPGHEKALCGVFTTNRRFHEPHCKTCMKLRPQKPGPSAPVIVAKIEPGQDFNLSGVIASLEITRDRLFEQLDQMERLITNLKGYRDAESKLVSLEQESRDRIQAARELLNEGKL